MHDHNEQKVIKLIEKNVKDQIITLISDAGSPLVSDPGYKLVKHFVENDIFVTTIPGPTSIVPALQLSTLPMNEFQFIGFAPKSKKALDSYFKNIINTDLTSVFFTSSHRVIICLKALQGVLKDRKIAVCKEITKINERTFIGIPSKVINEIENERKNIRGEFVVIVEGNKKKSKKNQIINSEIEKQISKLLEKFSLTDVVEIVHKFSYFGKKQIYKMALKLKK